MLSERVARPAAFPSGLSVMEFVRHTMAVTEYEIRKLRHDPLGLFTRSVQPLLWLLIFGQVFARLREVPTGGVPYLDFMTPGILAQSVLFVAIFFGISVIWERDLGILHKFLVSPASRVSLVLGKALASGVRGVSQALVVYVVALLLGVHARVIVDAVLGVVASIVLASAIFSTFSLIIACLVKTRERFMGVGQVLTMPFFFASNAIYPIAMMPSWLQVVAAVNPLSYQVDALRALMIEGGHSVSGLAFDFALQIGILVVLVFVASRVYANIAR